MRRLLTISYVGTAYHGWQVQHNACTVQQCVQNALERVLGHRPDLTGCSRTDAGVHARAFCAHFDSDSTIPNRRLPIALNAHLPADIAVTSCISVADDFHARYNALGKTYCYQILNRATRDPFLQQQCWQVSHPIDLQSLNRCAAAFVGTHDFKGFCASGSSVVDTVRTVTDCHAEQDGALIRLYITANGFLYNMVRIITGTLIDIQRGKLAEDALDEIIASCARENAGVTAPPHGLFLEKVHYAMDLETGDSHG